jgi:hypothetical protein
MGKSFVRMSFVNSSVAFFFQNGITLIELKLKADSN